MKIRLSWKLTSVFCIIIFFVLSIVYFYINTHLTEYLEQRIRYGLKRDLLLSKNLLEDEYKRGIDPSEELLLAKRIGSSLNLRATILNASGDVMGDSDIEETELGSVENHITRLEIQDALKHGFGESKRFSATKGIDMLYMAVPMAGERTPGFLRLALPLSELRLLASKIRKIIIVSALLGIMLTIALGIIISLMISKPLFEMSVIAKRMAAGDFSRKIRLRSSDEIGDLAESLNHMAEEIKNKMDRISYEEAKLNAVIVSMFEGILLTDETGRILMMNPSLRKLYLIDFPPEGKRPIEVLRNNNIQEMVDIIIKDGGNVTREDNFSHLSRERTILINGTPVIKEGGMRGAVLVFHDITEIKRLENIRRDFVANVSHELRTPLSNIKGYAETLLDGAIGDKVNAVEFTKIIHRESERLSSIIDDLLDISKIESGKMNMVFMPVEIKTVVKKVLDILKNSAAGKTISMQMHVPDGLPKIKADEGRLTQALLNLLDNAVKYTPRNGSVIISAVRKGCFLLIEVTDTGIGIPEKDLPRIFERFYRVDKARSRDLGGTGLGLSIVKHIIQFHGGDVWASSIPGSGSTFSFTIPLA